MKVCLIGNGLTNHILACGLVKKKIKVDLYAKRKENNQTTRTIGITNENRKYLNKYISNIDKLLWPIDNIKIYNENSFEKEIISFNKNKESK